VNWLPARIVELSELTLPSDWRDRLANARSKEFSAVLKNTSGPIHLPVVEASTGEIVAGVDRIAALVNGGEKRFECRIWTGSPAEKRMLRASENLHRRRDDDGKWLAEYLEAVKSSRLEQREAQLSAERPKKRGRPKSEGSGAREEAAATLGVDPEMLRSRERRAAAKEAKESEDKADVAPAPSPKPARVETRLKRFADELGALKDTMRAFLAELTEANVQEAMMALDTALARLVACEDSIGLAVDAIERGRRALADSNRPIGQVRASRNPAMRKPQVGLGGRKLHPEAIIDGETGLPFTFAPEDLGETREPGSDDVPEDDGTETEVL